MGIINVLSKHMAELIAAGEVVERPASVIKELVENAIDAGASSVTVEIKNGGITFMRVSDNGCGILRDDIAKAFLPHATSKINCADDLDGIVTLGFRGEALSSISSVSRLEILTKNKADDIGSRYKIEGGTPGELEETGCPVGTVIFVRDLFYNIPARMKFLKKDVSEGNAVSGVVDKIAVSHPEIAFTYIKDDKVVLKTSGDGKLLPAVYSVYGKDFANGLIPVNYERDGICMSGFISKPANARANRNMQIFFINGRYVKSKTASAAVEEASKGMVMAGKFLSCIINIQLSHEAVDVNVHPSKVEVRFVNERPIFETVYHGVKSSLVQADAQKEITFHETVFNNDPVQVKAAEKPNQDGIRFHEEAAISDIDDEPVVYMPSKTMGFAIPQSANVSFQNVVSPPKEIKPFFEKEPEKQEAEFIGELFKTYILAEKPSGEMLLIDKHAAHERIIYETLKKDKKQVFSQVLLFPVTVTMEKNDYDSALLNLDVFKAAGFELEDFGDGVLIVRSVPQILEKESIEDIVAEMAGYFSDHNTLARSQKEDWIFNNTACRAAIKAGDKTSDLELIKILRTVEEDESIRYCPHGRPVCIVLKKKEIEKFFGRG